MKHFQPLLAILLLALMVLLLALWTGLSPVNLPWGGVAIAAKPPDPQLLQRRLRLPEGFVIDTYATGLPRVRLMRFTAEGDLLVSLPASGSIVLLQRDADGDGRPDGRADLLIGLNVPHGIDLHDGWLYVAETDRIGRIRYDASARRIRGTMERVVQGLPGGGDHWSRTLKFGPDGWMYVSVGSSCNVCIEADPRRATLLRYRPDGSGGEIYAGGLRNTVGFAWRPGTQELYGVDNGRDLLGDNFPPDELNRIEQGGFYGWPFAHDNRIADPDYGQGHAGEIRRSIPPAHEFRAHVAPLSITFLRGERLPPEYRGVALAALHGSWNRSRKQGYEVVTLRFAADGRIDESPFLTGFELNEDVIGRPVDVAEGPDGAIYISDDYAGAIYRVRYVGRLAKPGEKP